MYGRFASNINSNIKKIKFVFYYSFLLFLINNNNNIYE
jgi:hypothetical protein